MKKEVSASELYQRRELAFSILDRIWEKVPGVSEEEARADIEQAIVEARAEKIHEMPLKFQYNLGEHTSEN